MVQLYQIQTKKIEKFIINLYLLKLMRNKQNINKFRIKNNCIFIEDEFTGIFNVNKELRWLDINDQININTMFISNKFNGTIVPINNITNLNLSRDFNKPLNNDMVKYIKEISLSIYDNYKLLFNTLDVLYNTNIQIMTINSGNFTNLKTNVFPKNLKRLIIKSCIINQSIDYLFPDSLEELIFKDCSFYTANINYLPTNLKILKINCRCDDIAPNINYVNCYLEFLDIDFEYPVNINTENSYKLKIFKYNQFAKNAYIKTILSNSIEKLVIENTNFKDLININFPKMLNSIDIIDKNSIIDQIGINKTKQNFLLDGENIEFDINTEHQCIKFRCCYYKQQNKRKFEG